MRKNNFTTAAQARDAYRSSSGPVVLQGIMEAWVRLAVTFAELDELRRRLCEDRGKEDRRTTDDEIYALVDEKMKTAHLADVSKATSVNEIRLLYHRLDSIPRE